MCQEIIFIIIFSYNTRSGQFQNFNFYLKTVPDCYPCIARNQFPVSDSESQPSHLSQFHAHACRRNARPQRARFHAHDLTTRHDAYTAHTCGRVATCAHMTYM